MIRKSIIISLLRCGTMHIEMTFLMNPGITLCTPRRGAVLMQHLLEIARRIYAQRTSRDRQIGDGSSHPIMVIPASLTKTGHKLIVRDAHIRGTVTGLGVPTQDSKSIPFLIQSWEEKVWGNPGVYRSLTLSDSAQKLLSIFSLSQAENVDPYSVAEGFGEAQNNCAGQVGDVYLNTNYEVVGGG